MDDLTEELGELGDQIRQLQHLADLAGECGFTELEKLLRRDLVEARLWHSLIAVKLPPAQEEANK